MLSSFSWTRLCCFQLFSNGDLQQEEQPIQFSVFFVASPYTNERFHGVIYYHNYFHPNVLLHFLISAFSLTQYVLVQHHFLFSLCFKTTLSSQSLSLSLLVVLKSMSSLSSSPINVLTLILCQRFLFYKQPIC